MEVITEDTTWIVHNIKHAEAGKIVGLIIRPRIYTYNEKGERL